MNLDRGGPRIALRAPAGEPAALGADDRSGIIIGVRGGDRAGGAGQRHSRPGSPSSSPSLGTQITVSPTRGSARTAVRASRSPTPTSTRSREPRTGPGRRHASTPVVTGSALLQQPARASATGQRSPARRRTTPTSPTCDLVVGSFFDEPQERVEGQASWCSARSPVTEAVRRQRRRRRSASSVRIGRTTFRVIGVAEAERPARTTSRTCRSTAARSYVLGGGDEINTVIVDRRRRRRTPCPRPWQQVTSILDAAAPDHRLRPNATSTPAPSSDLHRPVRRSS